MSAFVAPRVLVVEDDEAVALLLQSLLTRGGCLTQVAPTGREALAQARTGDLDLVLLDLMLPDLSGMELCQELRTRVGEVYLPILMLTGLTSDQERVAGFAAGADDYITKPFSAAELLSRVRVWIQVRQRLVANHQKLTAQAQALQEAEQRAMAAQIEAIHLAARELTDLVNNKLALAKGTLELLQTEADLAPSLQRMAAQAERRLAEAAECIQRLERVVRLKIKPTATGPALDLAASARDRRPTSQPVRRRHGQSLPRDGRDS